MREVDGSYLLTGALSGLDPNLQIRRLPLGGGKVGHSDAACR